MKKLTTYLLFDGTCGQAMNFYKSVFGGDLTATTVGNSPMASAFPAELHGRVVHARLAGGGVDLSASDWLAVNEKPVRGNMNCLYIDGDTPVATRAVFEKLSKGGTVTDPFEGKPFGWYGRLIDAFGVIWMFHADNA
jgi:PhnB protein